VIHKLPHQPLQDLAQSSFAIVSRWCLRAFRFVPRVRLSQRVDRGKSPPPERRESSWHTSRWNDRKYERPPVGRALFLKASVGKERTCLRRPAICRRSFRRTGSGRKMAMVESAPRKPQRRSGLSTSSSQNAACFAGDRAGNYRSAKSSGRRRAAGRVWIRSA
jgi:hypothetical protein